MGRVGDSPRGQGGQLLAHRARVWVRVEPTQVQQLRGQNVGERVCRQGKGLIRADARHDLAPNRRFQRWQTLGSARVTTTAACFSPTSDADAQRRAVGRAQQNAAQGPRPTGNGLRMSRAAKCGAKTLLARTHPCDVTRRAAIFARCSPDIAVTWDTTCHKTQRSLVAAKSCAICC